MSRDEDKEMIAAYANSIQRAIEHMMNAMEQKDLFFAGKHATVAYFECEKLFRLVSGLGEDGNSKNKAKTGVK